MDKNCLILLLCLSIFILNTSTQTICPKNCITCSSSTVCTTCSTGYYKDSTSQCRPCNTGCLSCSSPVTGSTIPKCSTCMTGFNLNPTTFDCFTCSSSCLTCSQIATNCTTCPQGTTYKIVNGSGTCYRDPTCLNNACLACKIGSGNLCQSCKSGYFLRTSGECPSCPYPCINCKYTIDSASIINNYNLGIVQIKNTIILYNEYLIQLVDVMNRYKKYLDIQRLNPTVVFDIFLQDANYSLIPAALKLNFTGPNFTSQLIKASPYFNLLVDQSFFNGFSYLLYNRMNMYTQKFVLYVQNLANSTNSTNPTSPTDNILQFLGFNYTDTDNDGIVDIGNATDNWRDYFGNYTSYFGNGTEQSVNIDHFYNVLYTQASFKRYFNGSLDNLKSSNYSTYFNFEMAPPKCLDCVKGFYYDQTQMICISCSANCIDCSSNTTCLLCVNGYYFNQITSLCQTCVSQCLTCSGSSTNCTSCNMGLKLTSTNKCIQCITPCLTCKQTDLTFCIECMSPYSLNANSLGVCFRCAQDICKLCDTTNSSICIQCNDGYSLVNGKCQLCPAKCLECSTPTLTNNISQCYLCEQRYVLNITTKLCDRCGPLCLQCKVGSPNICIKCEKGTYLSTTGTCNLCMTACLQCTNGETCTVYKDGIMLFGTQVISCRPGCKKCDTSNPQKCLACDDMFALQNDNCVKCASGCATCHPDNPLICLTCPSNRVKAIDNSCQLCNQTCTTCDTPTICTGCIRGFILDQQKKCVDASTVCPANCLQCNANKNCTQCSFGFVISSIGTCVQCVSSCGASCDASNPLVCTGCTVGFQSRQGKCIRCPIYCKKCSSGVCSQCDIGYQLSTLNSAIVCTKACIFPCKRCNATTCFQCTSNFTLTTGICQPDVTCGGKGCLFCPTGSFKANSGDCVKCTNNCASCITQNDCLVCRQGYFLQNNTCVSCPQGSQICRDSETSILCKPGYLLEALNFDSNSGSTATYSSTCKACQSPCKQCMFLPSLCITCINDQYRLNGTSCLRKKVVGSQIRFGLSYEQFLKGGKAQQILVSLADKVKGKIIITFMRSGSTVFGMAVSGDGTVSESSLANSLSTAVSSGSLGVPVMSSSVGIFVEDAPFIAPGSSQSKQSQINVGLIVGIIVGVVILIIITIVLVFKLRKKPERYIIKPESNTQLVDLRLRKKKGSSVEYSTLSSFANNSKVLFS